MSETPDAPHVSIVVTNWNGAAFIEECLSTLLASGDASGLPFELIVVDDCSTDGSPDTIATKFPSVRLVRNERNLGFAGTSNRGATEARAPIVIMMNNDMKVPPAFVATLVRAFHEEQARPGAAPLFCVGAKTVQWDDGTPNHLCMRAAWRRGGIGEEWSDPPTRVATTYAQGGSAAFDRVRYLALGGFDPIFHPTYWDDYDLCYRAAKAGWRILYEPLAVADHRGKATLKRQVNLSRLDQILERNRLWFTWLNLDDPILWARHILARPWILARDLREGTFGNTSRALWMALKGIGAIRRARAHRRRTDPPRLLPDRVLLRQFGR